VTGRHAAPEYLPTPDEQAAATTMQVEFSGGFDDETGMYQVGLMVPGVVIGINVHPDGFESLNGLLAALPDAVSEVIEQVVEARETPVTVPVETAIMDTP
jgi:hypothetical protein